MAFQCQQSVGTVYIHRIKHVNYRVDLSKTVVELLQEPRETVTISLEASGHELECGSSKISKYMYSCCLQFEEYPWKILQNYGYEIVCKALLDQGSKGIFHEHLFANRQMRSEGPRFYKTFYSEDKDDLKLIHLCFHIYRFNSKLSPRASTNFTESVTFPMLLKSGFKSDVSLIVGDKVIPAHKQILSTRSAVFKAMFSHEMSENESNLVKIDEVDSEVVEELLFYIYTGKTKNMPKMTLELFEIAHRYQLRELELKCEEHMLFNITVENLLSIRDLSILYELEDLKKATDVYISERESQLVKEHSFRQVLCQELNIENLVHTLKLCTKYNLEDVKKAAMEFVKHHQEVVESDSFLKYLDDNSKLAKEMFIYVHKKEK